VQAGQGAQDVGRAGTDLPGEGVDATAGDVERQRGEQARSREVADGHVGGVHSGRGLPDRWWHVAQHLADDLVGVQTDRRGGRHGASVADHCDAVAEVDDLAEPVRHEDDGAALGRGRADRGEDEIDLGAGERGRRLVQQQDLGAAPECAGDLDQLTLADAQGTEQGVGAEREPDAVEQGLRVPVYRAAVQQ
jgi:hypothetical protein